MGKKIQSAIKKQQEKQNALAIYQSSELQKAYQSELETNPEYSLLPDPEDKLNLSINAKNFILNYVNFKSIGTAAEMSGISADEAKELFVSYNVQTEIRRINRALYHRQFSSKLLSIDDIAGYLSCLLTDENVPLADQLKTTEKLRVVDLILRLNELKANSLQNPDKLAYSDIETQIKNLSIGAIKNLLVQNNTVVVQQKNEVIEQIDDGTLSPEEKAYLSSLPVKELLSLIDDTKKGG